MLETSRRDWVLTALVGIGVILRVRQFLFARSMWLDESWAANEILDSRLIDLLTQTQGYVDPAGYTILTKLGVAVLGPTEFAFRWIALVAGIASLIVASLLARRAFKTMVGQATFTGLVALAPVLVYYSNEAQQYALDILATVLVILIFVSFEEWRRGFASLVVVGVVLPWFSYSSTFVLFGVGFALAVRWLRDRSYRKCAILGSAWGLSTLVMLAHARSITRTEFLEDFWTTGFAPFPIASLADLRWYPESIAGIVEAAFFIERIVPAITVPSLAAWLILGSIVVGAVLLAGRRPWLTLALGAMLASGLIMSGLGLYPFGSRPGLYMVPLAFLLAVEPIDWATEQRSMAWRGPAALVAIALLATVAVPSARSFVDPPNPYDMKGALNFVVENGEPGDWLIVHGWSARPFTFYGPKYDLEPFIVEEMSRTFDAEEFLAEAGQDSVSGRTWFVFTHRQGQAEQFVDQLAELAPLLERTGDGSYLVALFDLSALGRMDQTEDR
jgi:hypothetical protein